MPQHNVVGTPPPSVVALLAERVLADLSGIAEAMAEQMVAAEPVYAERFGPEERLTACAQNVGALLGGLVSGPAEIDARPHEATGRRNAEMDVPLESLLHLYRLAAQMVWQRLIAACGDDAGLRDGLLEGATEVWAVTDVQSAIVVEAYKASRARIERDRDATRAAAVATLLAGGDGDRYAGRRAAAALGFGDGPLVALAHAAEGTDRRGAVRAALAARGIRSVWQGRGSVVVGVAAAVPPVDGATTSVLGVEPVRDDVTEVPAAVELAVLALRAAPRGARGAVRLEAVLPAALLLRSPDLARRVVEGVLGGSDEWRISHVALVDTLRAWVRCRGDARATAAALHCHRNTVFNRLRRLQELTDRSLSDPGALAELVLAVEALRLTGGASPG